MFKRIEHLPRADVGSFEGATAACMPWCALKRCGVETKAETRSRCCMSASTRPNRNRTRILRSWHTTPRVSRPDLLDRVTATCICGDFRLGGRETAGPGERGPTETQARVKPLPDGNVGGDALKATDAPPFIASVFYQSLRAPLWNPRASRPKVAKERSVEKGPVREILGAALLMVGSGVIRVHKGLRLVVISI